MTKKPAKPRKKVKAPARRHTITRAEGMAAVEAFENGPPIVVAILGQAILESELDELLRPKFKRKDDAAWANLIGENGPLDTFRRKIICAYALGIIDDQERQNLHVIRKVRNIFAHAKRVVDFDDPEVQYEISKIQSVQGKSVWAKNLRRLEKAAKAGSANRETYRSLCRVLKIRLMERIIRRLKSSNRWQATRNRNKYAKLLASNPFGPLNALTPGLGLFPETQISNPIHQAVGIGLLGEFPSPQPPSKRGKA